MTASNIYMGFLIVIFLFFLYLFLFKRKTNDLPVLSRPHYLVVYVFFVLGIYLLHTNVSNSLKFDVFLFSLGLILFFISIVFFSKFYLYKYCEKHSENIYGLLMINSLIIPLIFLFTFPYNPSVVLSILYFVYLVFLFTKALLIYATSCGYELAFEAKSILLYSFPSLVLLMNSFILYFLF